MTNPLRSVGINILARSPLIKGGTDTRDLTEKISGYEHEIQAFGGFATSRMSFQDNQNEAEKWFSDGLGWDIVAKGPETIPIFGGFVNQVGFSLGSLSTSRGPLVSIGNRVVIVYSKILDDTVSPPIVGSPEETPAAEDLESQALYGIWEKDLNGSQAFQAEIEDTRDTWLAEHKLPETSESRVSSQESNAKVDLTVDGYFNWLEAYPYNYLTAVTQQVTTKLKAVLSADTNGIFSTDQSNISDVLTLVSGYEDGNKTALSVIKSLVSIGDASFNRVLFQVLEDRKAWFYSLPTEISYYHRITNDGLILENAAGGTVYPWNVRPGKWLFLPDFLVGRVISSIKREDPRFIFIESVHYTAPWGLEINGSKIETVPQKLMQYGLGGLSA